MTPMRANIVGPRVEILAARLPHNHVGPQQETASLADPEASPSMGASSDPTSSSQSVSFCVPERRKICPLTSMHRQF